MMSLRSRLFVIISLVVLVILGISLLLLYRAKKQPAANTPSGSTTTVPAQNVIQRSNFNPAQLNIAPVQEIQAPARQPTTLEAEQNGVRQLAKIFVERYNTYSTDSNFQNIQEVETLVTQALWKRISRAIGSSNSSGNFMGVTTVVVSSKLTAWAPPTATVELKVQRTVDQNGASTQSAQTITVSLTKDGDAWLVNSFTVQK